MRMATVAYLSAIWMAMVAYRSSMRAANVAYRSAMRVTTVAYRSAMRVATAAYRSAMLAGVTVSMQMIDFPRTVVDANSTPRRHPEGLSISTSSGPAACSTASAETTEWYLFHTLYLLSNIYQL